MIIGLCGPARSGKDQTCQYIKEIATDFNVRRDAFADRLKISAARALGIEGSDEDCIHFCNWLKEEGELIAYPIGDFGEQAHVTGRRFLQLYGTEAHRDVFGDNFWIEAVLPAHYVSPSNEILVITDARFDNEARAIKDAGGVIWKIDRQAVIEESDHASEAGISPEYIDVIIDNNSDLNHLRDGVATALENQLFSQKQLQATIRETLRPS